MPTLASIVADLRYGWRKLRKSPGWTIVAVLTLAIGIGANAAMFAIVYGLLYRPLPFRDADRIAVVHMHFSPQNNARGNMSIADFIDWQRENRAFAKVALYSPTRLVIRGSGKPEEVAAAAVSSDYFAVLGIDFLRGRNFEPAQDSQPSGTSVVISDSLWLRRWGRSEDTVGRVIEVNGQPATIVGVVRDGYGFPRANVEVWQNLKLASNRRGPFFYHGVARLRDGVTMQQAQADTHAIAAHIEKANPASYSALSMPVEGFRDFTVGRIRPVLLLFAAAAGLMFLIGIVNIASLLLARSISRDHEIAVRVSMGATSLGLMSEDFPARSSSRACSAMQEWFRKQCPLRVQSRTT